jgi:hypothetical protein
MEVPELESLHVRDNFRNVRSSTSDTQLAVHIQFSSHCCFMSLKCRKKSEVLTDKVEILEINIRTR